MPEASFKIPNPIFRFLHSDIPFVALDSNVATACLDCGTIFTRADPLDLQKTAGRWMSDDTKRRALRLESTLDPTRHFLGYYGFLVVVAVTIIVAILVVYVILLRRFP